MNDLEQKLLDMIMTSSELIDKLHANITSFKSEMTRQGFTINPGAHAIIPIMTGDAELAQKTAAALLEKGVYVIGFSFPVVSKGKARIRTQISAVHSKENLEFVVGKFKEAKKAYDL